MFNDANSAIPYSVKPLHYSFISHEQLVAPPMLFYSPMAQMPKFQYDGTCRFKRVELSPELIKNVTQTKETKLKLITKTGKGKRSFVKPKSKANKQEYASLKAEVQPMLEAIQSTVFNAKKGSEEKMVAMGKLLVTALRQIPGREKLAKKIVTWTHKNYNSLKASEVRALVEKRLDYSSPNFMPRRTKNFLEPSRPELSNCFPKQPLAPPNNGITPCTKDILELQTSSELRQQLPEVIEEFKEQAIDRTILERFNSLHRDTDFSAN